MSCIVHFGKYYLPDAGGIESVTLSLARGAVHAGHAVQVVCFEKQPAPRHETLGGVCVQREPIACLVASQPLGVRYALTCLRAGRAADIVHLHSPNMLGALCALMIGRRPRLLVHWHSDVLNKGLLGRLLRPLESALLKRADTIVATSPVYVEASEQLRAFRDKVEVVPIGVPDVPSDRPAATSPMLATLRERVRQRRIVLAVGRLVDYKGFQGLIDAAAQLTDEAVVIIVGGGPLKETLVQRIADQGYGDRVLMAGRLSDEDLTALYQSAWLYCLPSTSRAEAFGVVLLEAMAHRLPIVATQIPGSGVPWVNQDGVSGINVPVGDAAALASACNRLVADDALRERLAQGARARYEAEFTESRSVERMNRLYVRLAGHH